MRSSADHFSTNACASRNKWLLAHLIWITDLMDFPSDFCSGRVVLTSLDILMITVCVNKRANGHDLPPLVSTGLNSFILCSSPVLNCARFHSTWPLLRMRNITLPMALARPTQSITFSISVYFITSLHFTVFTLLHLLLLCFLLFQITLLRTLHFPT